MRKAVRTILNPSGRRISILLCALLVVLIVGIGNVIPRDTSPPAGRGDDRQWPRSIPAPGDRGELTALEARGERNWAHLVYPGTSFPGDWQDTAQGHVRRRVPSGAWERGQEPSGDSAAAAPQGSRLPVGDRWTPVGPAPIDSTTIRAGYRYGLVTGRINALAVHPTDGATAYAGAASGGLWKTTTCCSAATTWTPLWENETIASQSVSAIEIDPTNPEIIYVGTGDFDARDQFGVGVMKSRDGGATWTLLGGGPNGIFTPFNTQARGPIGAHPPPSQNIGVIEVDPRNPATVLVGTQWGLFVSWDAGGTWAQVPVTNSFYTQRVSSLVLDTSVEPAVLYVALGYPYSTRRHPGVTGRANGVYKTVLGSSSIGQFALISTQANGWPANTGDCVQSCTVGRIRLAQARNDSRILYAQVSNYDVDFVNALGTWVTTNRGESWTKLGGSGDVSYTDCRGIQTAEQQDWYNLVLHVDPADDRRLFIGRTSMYRAVVDPTFRSFSSLVDLANVYTTACSGSYGKLHPDQHALLIRADGTLLVGNDGGVYQGTGEVGGWTALNNSLNTIQWYNGQLGANWGTTGRPGDGKQYALAGAQDNGSASWTSDNAALKWQARGGGGDGFFAAFDPVQGTLKAGNWYSEYTYGAILCSSTGGSGDYKPCEPPYGSMERPDFAAPFVLDQHHCSSAGCRNLLVATSEVWATGSGGLTSGAWTNVSPDLTKGAISSDTAANTLIDVRFALDNPRAAVVGSDDGNVQWSNTIYTSDNCTAAAADTADFSCQPNAAATWVNLTQGNQVLPNRAILGVNFRADSERTVYAAVGGFNTNTPHTPGHLFQATCAAQCEAAEQWIWTDKSGNLPDVPVTSVVSNPRNPRQVFAGTHFGFFFTNDIDAASPTWYQFQVGLPNTVIQYLTIDRGATTLAAWTFGRGLYVIALPQSGSLGNLPTEAPTSTSTPSPTATATATATSTATSTATATAPPQRWHIWLPLVGQESRE